VPERALRGPKSPDRSPSNPSPRVAEGLRRSGFRAQLARTAAISRSSALSASLPRESEPTRGRGIEQGGAFSTGEGGSVFNRPPPANVCAGGPLFNRRKWPTFQPALTPGAMRGRRAYAADAIAMQSPARPRRLRALPSGTSASAPATQTVRSRREPPCSWDAPGGNRTRGLGLKAPRPSRATCPTLRGVSRDRTSQDAVCDAVWFEVRDLAAASGRNWIFARKQLLTSLRQTAQRVLLSTPSLILESVVHFSDFDSRGYRTVDVRAGYAGVGGQI
jgi:hypothetical protein